VFSLCFVNRIHAVNHVAHGFKRTWWRAHNVIGIALEPTVLLAFALCTDACTINFCNG
jgi:hypothetical protein